MKKQVSGVLRHIQSSSARWFHAFLPELFGAQAAVIDRFLTRSNAAGMDVLLQRYSALRRLKFDSPEGAPAAVVKLPAHQIALIGEGFFLE